MSTRKGNNRIVRHSRIRSKVAGTALRPRLAVYRSNRYLEAQVIDDTLGRTLFSAKMDDAQKLGAEIVKRAKDAGITAVVFDRGGFRYAGAVKALADAVREGGLKF